MTAPGQPLTFADTQKLASNASILARCTLVSQAARDVAPNIKDAASQEAVTTDHVRVVEEHDRVWPDDDLGCVARKGLLEPSSIPGYAFVLDVDGRRFEYHADRAGRFKRCPPAKPRTRPIG